MSTTEDHSENEIPPTNEERIETLIEMLNGPVRDTPLYFELVNNLPVNCK